MIRSRQNPYAVLITLLLMYSASLGQVAGKRVDIRGLGFQLPPGVIRYPKGERVLTHDEDGEAVVAKVHVFVGENRIVQLPDGKLVARLADKSPPTERKFVAADPKKLAAKVVASLPSGFKSKITRRYVTVYNTSDVFATTTRTILESMIPGITNHAKQQKIKTHAPEVPLVAIMFRTEAEFQKFRRMPDGVVAYYNTLTNQIVMYEESKLVRLKPELAIQQAISTIAHEGAHQILHNIGVQQRLSNWPIWISEGLAEYYAPTSTGKRLRWKGAGHVNDLRMFELEQVFKGTVAPTRGRMIGDTVSSAKLDSSGYAAAWALTHFLAKTQKTEFNEYVNSISKLRPLEGFLRPDTEGKIPSHLNLFHRQFGDDDEKTENLLVKHLKRQPYKDPFAQWPHLLAMVSVPSRNGRRANVFHSTQRATDWIEKTRQTLPSPQRGQARATIRAFPNRAQAEAAARQWLNGG